MTEKLKPCPFCGRKDTEIEITQEFYSDQDVQTGY